jgi:hypothetical protein
VPTPCGDFVAVVTRNDQLALWDLQARTAAYKRGPGNDRVGAITLTLSPDGKSLLSTVEFQPRDKGYEIKMWETYSGLLRVSYFSRANKEYGWNGPISPDGRYLYLAIKRGGPAIMDLADGNIVHELEGFSRGGAGVSVFSPDGCFLASVSEDTDHQKNVAEMRQVKFYDRRTGKTLWRAKGEEKYGEWNVAFCLGGRVVATSNNAVPAIRFWDASTGDLVHTLKWGETVARGADGLGGGLASFDDGKMLVSGSNDHSALIWDLTKIPELQKVKPRPVADAPPPKKKEEPALEMKELDACWAKLAGSDGAEAYEAIWRLALHPKSSVPHLRERLKPAEMPKAETVARLIADLDDNEQVKRDAASENLRPIDLLSKPALRKARDDTKSAEVRRRLDELLKAVEPPISDGVTMRPIRAIEALERMETKEAMDILRELTKGHAGAWQTKDARLALERLERRQALLAPQK